MRQSDFKYIGYSDDEKEYIFVVKGKSLEEVTSICGMKPPGNVVIYSERYDESYVGNVWNNEKLNEILKKFIDSRCPDRRVKARSIDPILDELHIPKILR